MKTPDGKHIHCDGTACEATAYTPVGLRAALSFSRGGRKSGVEGWLFVDRGGESLHYCPICGKHYLRGLREKAEA